MQQPHLCVCLAAAVQRTSSASLCGFRLCCGQVGCQHGSDALSARRRRLTLPQATPHPAVVFMPEGSRTHMGGTMRLGARRTLLQTVDCISAKLYQVPRRSSQWVTACTG